jgi:GT2 family glycosyltransferase
LLVECLDALLNQTRPVDKIILVDNASTDGTRDFLEELGYLDNALIEYVSLPRNLGGAGGFHAGIKRGHQAGYDWLWVMDDDAEPEPSALEFLCRSEAMHSRKTVAVACKTVGKDGRIQNRHRARFSKQATLIPVPVQEYALEEIRIDHSSFVGLAIKSEVVSTAGLPRKDFFIWSDDLEYCLRIGEHGEVYLVSRSVIKHKDEVAPSVRRQFLFWTFERLLPIEGGYWKQLCGCRNTEYVRRTYGAGGVPKSLYRLLKKLGKILALEDHKLFRLRWTVVFYIDSYRSSFRARPPKPRSAATPREQGFAQR